MPELEPQIASDDDWSEILLPRLYERDIDVLLQEELIFNQALLKLFSSALGFSDSVSLRDCRLSVVDQTGETDVFAFFIAGDRRGVILIENKIDAGFQPRQPERYRERAKLLAAEGKLDQALCVLVAPKAYAHPGRGGLEYFDAIISYEDIASAVSSEQTERAKHRAALVLRAIEQARKSYTLAPVAEVRSLWQKIFDIASVEFPDLGMKPPSDKGAQSNWIIFKADLPANVTIDWKIEIPAIDLSFWPAAKIRPADNIDLSALPAARSRMNGRTAAIRLLGPRPPATWTEMTEEHIREGLSGAMHLLEFFRSNRNLFLEVRA